MRRTRSSARLCVALALLGALAAAQAPGAHARVALIATGTPEVTLLDVGTNRVAATVALPAASSAVSVTRDGRRGYVAAGSTLVALDLSSAPGSGSGSGAPGGPTGGAAAGPGGAAAAQLAERDLGARVIALALSPGGGFVYALAGRSLVVLDARTLKPVRSKALRGRPRALAISSDGTVVAVSVSGNRVTFLGTGRLRTLRRVRVRDPRAIAFAGARAWIVGARGLQSASPRRKKATRPIRLGRGVGGGIAISPDARQAAIGARAGGARAAIVDLAARRARGFRSGRGPGTPGWSPDGIRVYLADAGSAALSLVSPFAMRRIGSVSLPGTRPGGVAVQPGLARVAGTDGADVLAGTRMRDLLEGFGGDDQLGGGRENDILRGGAGNDTLVGGSYDDHLHGDDGDDRLVADSGNDRVWGGDGRDRAEGGTGDDSIRGGAGDDSLDGGAGDDRIFGEAGDDYINGGSFGNDGRLYGGPGNDEIHGGRGSDRLIKGGDGDDRLFGESGTENITGGDGDDLVDGGRARDLLGGNNGRDIVKGDAGDDAVEGGEGADTVDGGSGADEIYGDAGDDIVIGGPEPDMIDAGPGDDTIRAADLSIDEVDCGEGVDTVYVEDIAPTQDRLVDCENVVAIAPEVANDADPPSIIAGTRGRDVLRGTAGPDSLFGKAGADRLFGGGGEDYVDGEWGNDTLYGGPGADTLAGRSGDDRIFGDDGDDRITGDRGRDRIAGGGGNDTIFGNLDPDVVSGGSGNDRINVVRGGHDSVRCGRGRDVVFADAADRVARDCEDVRR